MFVRIKLNEITAVLLFTLVLVLSGTSQNFNERQTKVIASLLEGSSPEETLQQLQQIRENFHVKIFDTHYCHQEQCLVFPMTQLRNSAHTISWPLNQGQLLLMVNPQFNLIRTSFILLASLLCLIWPILSRVKNRKQELLIKEHSKYKSFFHDIQLVLAKIIQGNQVHQYQNELLSFYKDHQQKFFYSTDNVVNYLKEFNGKVSKGQQNLKILFGEIEKGTFYFQGDFYRNLRNLLNNAREASATEIKIEIKKNDSKLFINIIDNGKGFEAGTLKSVLKGHHPALLSGLGIGLRQMYETLKLSFGRLNIQSSSQFTTVSIELLDLKHVQFYQVEDDPFIQSFWMESFKNFKFNLFQSEAFEPLLNFRKKTN